jgi:hypothetical protein
VLDEVPIPKNELPINKYILAAVECLGFSVCNALKLPIFVSAVLLFNEQIALCVSRRLFFWISTFSISWQSFPTGCVGGESGSVVGTGQKNYSQYHRK